MAALARTVVRLPPIEPIRGVVDAQPDVRAGRAICLQPPESGARSNTGSALTKMNGPAGTLKRMT